MKANIIKGPHFEERTQKALKIIFDLVKEAIKKGELQLEKERVYVVKVQKK